MTFARTMPGMPFGCLCRFRSAMGEPVQKLAKQMERENWKSNWAKEVKRALIEVESVAWL